MGCPFEKTSDIEKSVQCLQAKPVDDLMRGLKMFDQCSSKYDFFAYIIQSIMK